AQQEAWRAARVHRSSVKQKRVDEDDVARGADVLDDLKLDAIVLLCAPHKARNALIGTCLFMQIADVMVTHERFAMITAACTRLRWMVREPTVKQPVRTGEKNGRSAPRLDIAH